jgi:hypothetical protein
MLYPKFRLFNHGYEFIEVVLEGNKIQNSKTENEERLDKQNLFLALLTHQQVASSLAVVARYCVLKRTEQHTMIVAYHDSSIP